MQLECRNENLKKPKNNLSFIEPHEEAEAEALIEKHLGFKPRDEIRIPGFCILVKIWYPDQYQTTKSINQESKIITPENSFPTADKSRFSLLEKQLSQIKKSNIILPDSALFFEKCRSCTALVVDIGPGAYKGERFKDWENGIPKVGDWVVIPKNEGNRIIVKSGENEFDMVIIYDDKIKAIVRDPSNVKIQM
jgi:hypothetical protein